MGTDQTRSSPRCGQCAARSAVCWPRRVGCSGRNSRSKRGRRAKRVPLRWASSFLDMASDLGGVVHRRIIGLWAARVQRPLRRPAPGFITHPPRFDLFLVAAMPAPDHLGAQAEQHQVTTRTLHGGRTDTGPLSDGGHRQATAAPRGGLSHARCGHHLAYRQEAAQAQLVALSPYAWVVGSEHRLCVDKPARAAVPRRDARVGPLRRVQMHRARQPAGGGTSRHRGLTPPHLTLPSRNRGAATLMTRTTATRAPRRRPQPG